MTTPGSGDVNVIHAALDAAISDLEQQAGQMVTAMDNLAQGLTSLKDTFTGSAADHYNEFQQAVSTADTQMQSDLNAAVKALYDIHANWNIADLRAAAMVGH